MNAKSTTFQIAIGIFFGLLFIIGFFLFATYKPIEDRDKTKIGKVKVWGTLDKHIFDILLQEITDNDQRFANVKYIQKQKDTYNNDILEAIASGKSPDLILLSNNDFLKNRNKIFVIGSDIFSKRDFYNTYADAFSIYVAEDGILGVPFVIDPMVMYFNKNLFATSRVVMPPKIWEEFEDPKGITSKIRKLNENGDILKSALSFGESINVKHYKEILYTLLMQKNESLLLEEENVYRFNKVKGANEIIKFYTEFSNPTNKITYSWNRAKGNSEQEFLSENLGIYFGFVSEIRRIRKKNINLNFDVAEIPGFDESQKKTVYARTWVFAVPKASQNKEGALGTAFELSSKKIQEILIDKIFLPPVRKDILNETPEDLFMEVFFREAIYANSILEPNPKKTSEIFSEFISNVSSGLRLPSEAADVLINEYDLLLRKFEF